MKRLSLCLLAAASLTILSACATPTPYQPVSPTTSAAAQRGYSETRIEENRYRLSFSGNEMTKRETVENYMLYRAAELTLESGNDWFEVVSRDTDEKQRATTFDDPFMSSFSWRFYNRNRWSRWGAFGADWGSDTVVYSRYEATAEILMHKGPKPDGNANAYDARAVKANLESKIVRPVSK
ncbi:MAG: hypothetical protein QM647_04515 [Asticcacaulis sp.]|uniref:CC0125/CC1285 family lipoprotein n=1 Tax=Asticcacaulis sp. TaxID=1872648 RepID=UPI0039E70A8C